MERPSPPPAIEVRNVSISREGSEALHGLSFGVARGDAVALVAGAALDLTALFDVLAGLEPPSSGEITWSGVSSAEIEAAPTARARYKLERELRLRAGYVAAGAPLLYNQTVFDNVALPLRYHSDASEEDVSSKADDLLRRLRIDGVSFLRPSALPRPLRKRAELARALILDPPLLLLDMPFAESDRGSVEVMSALIEERVRTGAFGVLVSAHEPAQVPSFARRTLLVEQGGIKEGA